MSGFTSIDYENLTFKEKLFQWNQQYQYFKIWFLSSFLSFGYSIWMNSIVVDEERSVELECIEIEWSAEKFDILKNSSYTGRSLFEKTKL